MREGSSLVPMNTVFLMDIDDVVVCHLGDLGAVPSSRLVAELSQAQVLLVPASGDCTLDLYQAVEVVQLIQPRVVIPMHHQAPVSEPVLGSVDAFLREMGAKELQAVPRLSLNTTSLPHETQVVLMALADT